MKKPTNIIQRPLPTQCKSKKVANLTRKDYLQDEAKLQTVFIDTFYDVNPSEKQTKKFNEYTNELWRFANKVEPFDMKDIEKALTELAQKA